MLFFLEINERLLEALLHKLFLKFQAHVRCNFTVKCIYSINIFVNLRHKSCNGYIWYFYLTKTYINILL